MRKRTARGRRLRIWCPSCWRRFLMAMPSSDEPVGRLSRRALLVVSPDMQTISLPEKWTAEVLRRSGWKVRNGTQEVLSALFLALDGFLYEAGRTFETLSQKLQFDSTSFLE